MEYYYLRFINDSCWGNNNAIELDHFTIRNVSSTNVWGYEAVELDTLKANSLRNISYYHGNNNSISTSNGTDTFFFFDHFLTSFDTNLWVNSSGTPTISNSIVEDTPQTSFRTIGNYQYDVLAGGNCSFEANPTVYWTGWGWNYGQDTARIMFMIVSNENRSNTRTGGTETNTILSDYTTPVDTYDWHYFEISFLKG